jgi:uncharacterized protein with ATP-grasp and redox domains
LPSSLALPEKKELATENGNDVPSMMLDRSSVAFQDLFDKADLVISNGQGNLEGLIAVEKSALFFLLMVKCDVIADLLGVKKGGFICYEKEGSNNNNN